MLRWPIVEACKRRQEGLAVASIARDDPSIGGGHVCWGSHDGFNFAGWRGRCVPGMHRDPMHFRHRQTDTDIVACIYYISR